MYILSQEELMLVADKILGHYSIEAALIEDAILSLDSFSKLTNISAKDIGNFYEIFDYVDNCSYCGIYVLLEEMVGDYCDDCDFEIQQAEDEEENEL